MITPQVWKTAITIRHFEQLLLKLFAEGKLNGTVHTCVGQELIPAVLAQHMKDLDTFFSNHRGHGHYLAKTGDLRGLLAEVMGRASGCSGGYGGSQHLLGEGFFSNGIQGGFAPVGVGFSLGRSQIAPETEPISVVFLGDGTLGEGVLYEALQLAALYKAPTLFVLENNGYAQSTSARQTFRGDLNARVTGFGIHFFSGSIWEPERLNTTVAEAVQKTRSCEPCFIEIDCYRLNSHSKGDDNRNPDEVRTFVERDPINQFALQQPELFSSLTQEVEAELQHILTAVTQDPLLTSPNVSELIHNTQCKYKALTLSDESIRLNEGIYRTLRGALECDELLHIFGEDIEDRNEFNPRSYGGAFKVTKDLSVLFPSRVNNTPISEAGVVGLGIGMALSGVRTVAEIMFGDFTTLVVDQILQQACKIQGMYGRRIPLPFMLRTPMGGKRGYGPTHSQSLERLFLGASHLEIIAPNYRVDPTELYGHWFKCSKSPALFIENKLDYGRFLNEAMNATHTYWLSDEQYPTLRISPREPAAGAAITLFCYGGTLWDCERALEEAFLEEEISVELIAPTRIQPLNLTPLIESVQRSKRLLVVEEGPSFAALGAEVVAALTEVKTPIQEFRRIGNNSVIPSSHAGELTLLPSVATIKRLIKEMV